MRWARRAGFALAALLVGQRLRAPRGQPALYNCSCRGDLCLGGSEREEGARLTHGQLTQRDEVEYRLGQVQQPDRVAHVGTTLADTGCDVVVGLTEVLVKALECASFFDRVEFLAGQVFDQ